MNLVAAFPLQYSGVGKQEERTSKESCDTNINSSTNSNTTASHCKRTFAMVSSLTTPKKNTTPRKNRINLHTAIEDAQWEVVGGILRQERGVFGRLRKKNSDNSVLLELDESRRTPLLEILSSSGQPPFDLIEMIISMEPRAAGIPDSRGRLPLHYAVVHKHDYRTIAHLIDVYPAALCATDKRKKTVLNYAMEMAQRKSTSSKQYWMPSHENTEWQEQTKQIWSVVELLLVSTATYPQTSLNLVNSTQKPMLVEALYHAASPSVISLFIGASVLLLSYENKTTAFAGSTLYLAISRHYSLPILSNLALQCPPDVYKVRDQTGMGLVAASYLSGVFNEVKNGEWCIDETFYENLTRGIQNRSLDQCGPGILDWWTKIEFLIALCACGRQKKDGDKKSYSDPKQFPKQYLLHAALDNSDTPPMVVRILLALYPESVHLADLNGELPLHIAVRSEDYIPRNFELQHNPHTSMELVLQASDPDVLFRRYENRLPLHHAIASGRNIDTLEVLLPEACIGGSATTSETELSREQTLLLQRDPVSKLFPFQLAASIPVEKNPFRWTCLARNQYSHHVWQGLSDRQKAVAVLKVSEDEELRRLETIYELLRRQPRAILGVNRPKQQPPTLVKQQQQKSSALIATTPTKYLTDDDDETETEVDMRSNAMMSGYLSASAASKKTTSSSGSSLSQQSDSTFFAKALETETPERQRAPTSSLLMLFSQHKNNTAANDDLYECDAASVFSTVDVMSILTTTIHTHEKSHGSLLSGSSEEDDDSSINIYSVSKEDDSTGSYDESSAQNSSTDFCESFAGATYYSEDDAKEDVDDSSCASDEESMVMFEIRKFPRISGKLVKSSEHSKLVSPVRLSKSPRGKVQMSEGLKSFSFSSRSKEANSVASIESSSNEKASVPSVFSDGYVSLQPGDLHKPSKEMLWMGSELLKPKKEQIVHHNELSSLSSSSVSKDRSKQSKSERSKSKSSERALQSSSRKTDSTGKSSTINPKVATQTGCETRLLGSWDEYSNSTDADALLEDIVGAGQEESINIGPFKGFPIKNAVGSRKTGQYAGATMNSISVVSNCSSRGPESQTSNDALSAAARNINSSILPNKDIPTTTENTETGSSGTRSLGRSESDKYFDKATMTWKIRSQQRECSTTANSEQSIPSEPKSEMRFDKKTMKWVPATTTLNNQVRPQPRVTFSVKREDSAKHSGIDHFAVIPKKQTKPKKVFSEVSQSESDSGPLVSIFGSSASRLPCIRCRNRDRQVLMIPCRHLCLCRECAENKEYIGKCPLCNKTVADTLSIF